MIYSITGRRDVKASSIPIIEEKISTLQNAERINFGGALGVDDIALHAADRLLPSSVELIVVFPDRIIPERIAGTRATCIELKKSITKDDYWYAFQFRNEHLVNYSDYLIAFWDGVKRGGTWNAMKYAKRIGRTCEIVMI